MQIINTKYVIILNENENEIKLLELKIYLLQIQLFLSIKKTIIIVKIEK